MSLNYLLTLPECISEIYSDPTEAEQDHHLEQRIDRYRSVAAQTIEDYLGYNPISSTYTDEVHHGPGKLIFTNHRPITSLIKVVNPLGEECTLSDFLVEEKKYIYRDNDVFSVGRWKIDYIAGYTSVTMPKNIKQAAIDLVVLLNSRSGPNGMVGVTSYSNDTISKSYDYNTERDNILSTIYSFKRIIV